MKFIIFTSWHRFDIYNIHIYSNNGNNAYLYMIQYNDIIIFKDYLYLYDQTRKLVKNVTVIFFSIVLMKLYIVLGQWLWCKFPPSLLYPSNHSSPQVTSSGVR